MISMTKALSLRPLGCSVWEGITRRYRGDDGSLRGGPDALSARRG
jgi:hypothetical protein